MSEHNLPPSFVPSRAGDQLAAALEKAIADITHPMELVLASGSAGDPAACADLARALTDSELLTLANVGTAEARDAMARLRWVRAVAQMLLTDPPKSECEGAEAFIDSEPDPRR